MIRCFGCGKMLYESARSCPHCGAVIKAYSSGSKNRIVAALLAFFLGGFGAISFIWAREVWEFYIWYFAGRSFLHLSHSLNLLFISVFPMKILPENMARKVPSYIEGIFNE
ncbi:hypothetical protein PAU_04129 [Photorhabdus asymbiotica]|uniref:Zinc-ribbon domain-containing protein n=2 Tax=Photorhabdus asymbiotica TaxID=291112 RepID=C7BQI7_PHOAA|nr:hypothetical protein PAU_04129 [Photorhabdus asymbiotica]